jgi:hypothetical protein
MPLANPHAPANRPTPSQPSQPSHLYFAPRKLATPLALAAASSLAAALLLAYLASPAAAAAQNPPPIPSFSYAAIAAAAALVGLAVAALALRSPILILDPAGIRFRPLPLIPLAALAWPQLSSFTLSTRSLTLHPSKASQPTSPISTPVQLLDPAQRSLLQAALAGRLPEATPHTSPPSH